MKKLTYLIPAVLASLITVYAPLSFAGIVRPCHGNNLTVVGQADIPGSDGTSTLRIIARKAQWVCELSTYDAIRIDARIYVKPGTRPPSDGYLTGRYMGYNQQGELVEERNYEKSFFLIDSEFLKPTMKKLYVEVEEFGSVEIDLK